MKKFLLCLAIMMIFANSELYSGEIKVLTIGNSFADSVFTYLPQIAASVPGCNLKLDRANIGGCSFQRHWQEHLKSEANSSYKPYYNKFTLKEKLLSEKWDIITIQQVSYASWQKKTFQPYADNLIKLIRECVPSAEIVIQQTWSYHKDSPNISSGQNGYWGFDQQGMFQRLDQCYRELAQNHKLRIIPSGLAVEFCRQALPAGAEDPVGGLTYWITQNDKRVKVTDYIHLNHRGEYLQACVWFAFLFSKNCSEIAFIPENITPGEALLLQKCAQKAIDNNR